MLQRKVEVFGKKGADKAIDEVRQHFSYLFDDGFQVAKTEYDAKHFGNWGVVLRSAKCTIRINQDRRYILVLIGPPWQPADAEPDHRYYDLR